MGGKFKVKDHYFKKAKKQDFLARSVFKLEEIDQKEKDDELLNTAEESFNTEQANSVGGDRENDSFGSSPGMDDEIEQVVVGLDNKKKAVLARLKKKL